MSTLYISQQGAVLSKTSERLKISVDKEVISEIPLIHVSQVVIFGRVMITPATLDLLLRHEIEVCYLTQHGNYIGRTQPEISKSGALRFEQYRAADNPKRRLELARGFVLGKLANLRILLLEKTRKEGKTEVKLLWDEKNLYVAMVAKDDFLKSEYRKHDDSLWKQDAFEVFLDPLGDGKDYYELQVNPAGVVFDSKLPAHRKNQNEWSSKMVVKTTMDGTLNDEKGDRGWTAELEIPFSSLDTQEGVPPKPGTSWTANFFRVN